MVELIVLIHYLQFCTQATPGCLAVLEKTEKDMVVMNEMN